MCVRHTVLIWALIGKTKKCKIICGEKRWVTPRSDRVEQRVSVRASERERVTRALSTWDCFIVHSRAIVVTTVI